MITLPMAPTPVVIIRRRPVSLWDEMQTKQAVANANDELDTDVSEHEPNYDDIVMEQFENEECRVRDLDYERPAYDEWRRDEDVRRDHEETRRECDHGTQFLRYGY